MKKNPLLTKQDLVEVIVVLVLGVTGLITGFVGLAAFLVERNAQLGLGMMLLGGLLLSLAESRLSPPQHAIETRADPPGIAGKIDGIQTPLDDD